jgi:hypothetical protein
MGLAGNLNTMQPADLLQWLSLGQKTGTLFINSPEVDKRIFFKRGRILSSASTDPREYLGQFLMSHGYISEDELKKAMEVQSQSKILLGKILVMINAISEENLMRLMRRKAEEEIYDIFLWPAGEFHFEDDQLPTMELIPLQVDVTGIILEGTRRVDEWKRLRSVIPTTNLIPVIDKPIDVKPLSDVQRIILQSVNGRRSIDEIVLETRASHFVVAEAICDWVNEGAVRLLEPKQKDWAAVPAVDHLPQAVRPAPMDSDAEIVSLLARAQSELRSGDYEKSFRILKAAQNLDPNNVTVRNALRGAETFISGELKKSGLLESKVPKILKSYEEITTLNFTPNEGFILSRINGFWDLGSIVKISPMREIDALLIFHRLHKDGIISL